MEISPSVLQFKGNFTAPTTEYLTFTNTSSTPLAFKVKTTAPKLYCVRPNASVVDPGVTVKISIILQGFAQPLKKSYVCKDKFLIVSLPCPEIEDSSKVGEIWPELESKYKQQLVSKKLRVNYIITEDDEEEYDATSTPVNNKSIDSNNNVSSASEEAAGIIAASQISHTKDLQKELDASSAPINNLSEKLDSNESNGASEKSNLATTESGYEEPSSGFSLQFALILVVLAFILGWFIF